MPNLTFFICAGIAACSCLAAFMVRKEDRLRQNTEESGLLGSDTSTIVEDDFVIDGLSIGNPKRTSSNSIPFVH
jgi:hypothetical protein